MTKLKMRLEIKEISAEGSFEGLLSPYGGKPDSYGDIVDAGAYNKTIKDHGNKVPLLWAHKTDTPVGELILEDRPDGLWCKGQLLLPLQKAQEAYLLIKAQIVKGLSIGYETVKDSVENGVRHLKEVRLYEGSLVVFPANLSALIVSVKAIGTAETKGDFNEELAEVQLQDAGCQILYALRCALGSLTWSDLTREEKLTAAEVICQQFTDAYLAYLPPYIDLLAEMYGGMEMMAAKRLEQKSGRMISLANKEIINSAADHYKSAHEHMAAGNEILLALIADEAATPPKGAGTPETKAAPKPEPVPDHSALFAVAKESFQWNHSKNN